MSDLRNVLYVVGSHDVAGVGGAALDTAETLNRAGWLRPVVRGPAGELVDYAVALGLPASALPAASGVSHRDGSLERAIGDADLVHAVGLEAARLACSARGPKSVPLVVTIDATSSRRILRGRHGMPLPGIRGYSELRWLIPGRTATSRLVESGFVRGDQVVTLPLLPFAQELHEEWAVMRAAGRERLGIAPGVQVVLGIGPANWALLQRGGSGITYRAGGAEVVWIDTGRSKYQRRPRRGGPIVLGPAEGRQLLPAMDVLLAHGMELVARHPAVDARWAGVPVVTTSVDAGAEMVRHSVNGYVCAPAEFMPAVEAALDMAASRALAHQTADRVADPAAEAVSATARCYSSILGHPLVRPVLIGRQAAR